MHRTVLIIISCGILFLTSGWNWQTHTALVESVYYVLPVEVSSLLDLSALRNGSIAPDRDFHDTRLHHYPHSYNKTLYWLNQTRIGIKEKNYSHASYSFGVASHYVDDSFAAPHNIQKEPYALHKAYEDQASQAYLFVQCENNTELSILEEQLIEATKTNETWDRWIRTRNQTIPAYAVAESYKVVLSLALLTFDTPCLKKETFVGKDDFSYIAWDTILLSSILLYLLLALTISLLQDVKESS